MADGPVYTNLDWDDEDFYVKAYCHIDGTDHNDLLERLFDAAKRKADE